MSRAAPPFLPISYPVIPYASLLFFLRYQIVPAAPAAPAVPSPANFAAELQSLVGANGVRNLRHVEKSEMSHKNPALRGNVKMEEKKAT